jgi:hypothetical protein
MAVPKNQVSDWLQAYDYMYESAKSATKGVCPGAASTYSALAEKYRELSGWVGNLTVFDRQEFLADLQLADAACKASPDYAKKTGVPTAPAGSPSTAPKVDPATGGASPDITDITNGIARAGIPWWVWLAGGGVLYLLLRKKGKK